jgi:hypothetical protein
MKLITHEKHKELLGRGYSFDHILILKEIDQGFQIDMEDSKVAILHQSLVRKGLLFETENKLTTIGKELLVFVDSKDRKRIVKPKVESIEFDQWWDAYPRGDTFEYKGKKFVGSRSFRVGKDECRTKFNKILLEGEVSASQLIEALKLEIFQKKERSIKENQNKMAYFQNSLTWLNQRSYDGFLDLIKSGVKVEETSKPTNETYI